jgi:succinoglycan biosynthesis protein ExoM
MTRGERPRRIAICVATYRRPERLASLLADLTHVRVPTECTVEVRVVDNDSGGSAHRTVAAWAAEPSCPFAVSYGVEPRQNIAHARNALVARGHADLIAFVDDDESVPPDWLESLVAARDRHDADVVIGPVLAHYGGHVPAWIRRGGFLDHGTVPEESTIGWNGTRAGNTLVRGRWFSESGLRFDPAFGRSGGEDTELFARMSELGGRFVCAPHAVVREHVDTQRVSFSWLLRRRVRCAANYQRIADRHPTGLPAWMHWSASALRSCGRTLLGLPALLLARPERAAAGVLGLVAAVSGLGASLRPRRAALAVAYGEGRHGA